MQKSTVVYSNLTKWLRYTVALRNYSISQSQRSEAIQQLKELKSEKVLLKICFSSNTLSWFTDTDEITIMIALQTQCRFWCSLPSHIFWPYYFLIKRAYSKYSSGKLEIARSLLTLKTTTTGSGVTNFQTWLLATPELLELPWHVTHLISKLPISASLQNKGRTCDTSLPLATPFCGMGNTQQPVRSATHCQMEN